MSEVITRMRRCRVSRSSLRCSSRRNASRRMAALLSCCIATVEFRLRELHKSHTFCCPRWLLLLRGSHADATFYRPNKRRKGAAAAVPQWYPPLEEKPTMAKDLFTCFCFAFFFLLLRSLPDGAWSSPSSSSSATQSKVVVSATAAAKHSYQNPSQAAPRQRRAVHFIGKGAEKMHYSY